MLKVKAYLIFFKYKVLLKSERNQISVGILKGLASLHKAVLIHYDLRPSIIL